MTRIRTTMRRTPQMMARAMTTLRYSVGANEVRLAWSGIDPPPPPLAPTVTVAVVGDGSSPPSTKTVTRAVDCLGGVAEFCATTANVYVDPTTSLPACSSPVLTSMENNLNNRRMCNKSRSIGWILWLSRSKVTSKAYLNAKFNVEISFSLTLSPIPIILCGLARFGQNIKPVSNGESYKTYQILSIKIQTSLTLSIIHWFCYVINCIFRCQCASLRWYFS